MKYIVEPWETKLIEQEFVDHFQSLIRSTLIIPEKNIDEFKLWPPNERYYISWKAAKAASSLNGDFVECGVFKGEQAFYMAKECKTTLHLFDSWQGADSLGEYDNVFYKENNFKCLVEDAESTMSEFNNVRFYNGHVPFGFNSVEKISLLNIDLDLYEPTKVSLEHLWPKVVSGGITLIDFHDGVSSGAEKATMEYFSDKDQDLNVLPTGKAIVVKK
jgi:hypothetical protein